MKLEFENDWKVRGFQLIEISWYRSIALRQIYFTFIILGIGFTSTTRIRR